ncbi:MAG: aminodeoxychorismate/anthranilate synthase component II [candidate division Zixibacteria bacterium]|nr:aminodeoxychorismate/anthranilate synthase component II [candidate division Zixibacteria bacterium]
MTSDPERDQRPTVFILDNHDSFTFNLVQYLGELGARVTTALNDEISVAEVLALRATGIVLSPGPGRPEQAGVLNDVVRAAVGAVPVLGVCLGHQAIAQVHGAELDYAPELMHGKTSDIEHDGTGLFRGIGSPLRATRYHSLVVRPGTLTEEFRVNARVADGSIMAFEHRREPLWGVQFHPESILTPDGRQILRNFIDLAAAWTAGQ